MEKGEIGRQVIGTGFLSERWKCPGISVRVAQL